MNTVQRRVHRFIKQSQLMYRRMRSSPIVVTLVGVCAAACVFYYSYTGVTTHARSGTTILDTVMCESYVTEALKQRQHVTNNEQDIDATPMSLASISPSLYQHLHVPPDIWLQTFAPHQLSQHRNLLTYKPVIDCDHGRYLRIDSIKYDGFGNMLLHYNSMLHLAMTWNLTVIHDLSILRSWHNDDETGLSREMWMKTLDWEIDLPAYQQCRPDSNVKLNHLRINDTYKWPWLDDAPNYKTYQQFTADLQSQSTDTTMPGYLVTVRDVTNRNAGGAMLKHTQLIHELRRHAHNGVVLPTQPSNTITMAIHLRRGDLFKKFDPVYQLGWTKRGYVGRWFTLPVINQICDIILQRIDLSAYHVNIELYVELPPDVMSDTSYMQPVIDHIDTYTNVAIHLIVNGPSTVALEGLRTADIVVMSPSSYSHAAGLFNSESVKLGGHWYSDFNGMRGYVYMDIQSHYTTSQQKDMDKLSTNQLICADCFNQTATLADVDVLKQQLDKLLLRKASQQPVNAFLQNYGVTYPKQWLS